MRGLFLQSVIRLIIVCRHLPKEEPPAVGATSLPNSLKMSGRASFSWASRGLSQARFQAYMKLLRLRNGGQVAELVDSSPFLGDEDDVNDTEVGDSLCPTTLCDSREDEVRKAFLDRLAELVSTFKGGKHVSACLMVQWPDRVEVLVAKNSGIGKDDATWTFLKDLEDMLRRYASAGGGMSHLQFPA